MVNFEALRLGQPISVIAIPGLQAHKNNGTNGLQS